MIKAKRFWKEVTVDDGLVLLDGRPINTPHKTLIKIPYPTLAELVANEWRAIEGEVNPNQLPMTRMVNSAIDHVSKKRDEIVDHLLTYLETDLIIYRAMEPEELVIRQSQLDVWLDWAAAQGIKLTTTTGIIYQEQLASNASIARSWFETLDDYKLVAAHDAITLLGSFVLGMAVVTGTLDESDAFALSQIDESFQSDQWGEDELAVEQRESRALAMKQTGIFLLAVE